MKIGLTTTSFRWDQGAERFVVNLTRGLLNENHEVHVIGRLEKAGVLEVFLDSLSREHRNRFFFHRVKTIKATKYLNLITFANQVHKKLRSLDLDIVQGFGKSMGLDVFRPPTGTQKAYLLENQKKIKLQPCTYMELAIEKRLLLSGAKVVVVNSKLSEQRIKKVYPDLKIPVQVIPNMVDLPYWQVNKASSIASDSRTKLKIPADDVVFLHVSTSFVKKGVPEAVEAMKILSAKIPKKEFQRLRLLLVGEGDFPIPFELQDQILVFPRTDDIRPYYFASDVLLHPTHYDSYANVVLEAFACGLPVMTTKKNGAVEALDDGVNGIILDAVDPVQIADGIYRFLKDFNLDEMAGAARKKANDFSPEVITNQFIELYKSLPENSKNDKNLTVRPWEAFFNQKLKLDFIQHFNQNRLLND